MKNILAYLIVIAMLAGLTTATSVPGWLAQTTPTWGSPVQNVAWQLLGNASPIKYNVSMEGQQVLLVIPLNDTKLTIPYGVGQLAPTKNITQGNQIKLSAGVNNIYAIVLTTSKYEQNNGTIVARANDSAEVALVNLHELFY